MSYWSWDNGRTNGLKGVDGVIVALDDCHGRSVYQPDPTNPAVLDGNTILYALRTSIRARNDFRRLFPTLLPDEQARLTALLDVNPRISALVQDNHDFADNIQSNWNTKIPVRSANPGHGSAHMRNDRRPWPHGNRED